MSKRAPETDIAPSGQRTKTQEDINNEFTKAVRERDYTTISKMLDKKLISPNHEMMDGMLHPLVIAAFTGEAKVVKLLIEKGADIEKLSMGMSPLAQASQKGNTACVQELIDAGAKLDETIWPLDQTCMIVAAMKGHDAVVYQLLMAGANKKLRDGNGKTALDYAKESGNKRTIALLEMENFPPSLSTV